MQKTCPSCNAVFQLTSPSMRFCPDCGAALAPEGPAGDGVSAARLASIRKPLLPTGILVLAASIAYGFLAESSGVKTFEREIAETQNELDRVIAKRQRIDDEMRPAKVRLEQAEAKVANSAAACQALAKEDDRLAGDTASAISSAQEALDAVRGRKKEQDQRQAKVEARAETVRQGQERDRTAGKHLSDYQRAVVTVFSSDMHVATGFVLSIDGRKHYVATVAEATPFGKTLACTFRKSESGRTENDFTTGKARLIFMDEHLGLSLLVCEPEGSAFVSALDVARRKASDAKKGQKVFAIGTQVLGSTAFSDNVFDGTISATDRSEGGLPLLQTTLPANPGSIGSPVMNQEGEFVGILLGSKRGLERTSVAIPVSALSDVLARMKKEIERGAKPGEVTYTSPSSSRTMLEADAKKRPLPYKEEDSLQLPVPYGKELDLFPGPSDTIIVWNKEDMTLTAHKKGLDRPLWQKTLRSRGYINPNVAYMPWGDRVLITNGLTENPSSEMSLTMGSTTGKIPTIKSVDDTVFSRPYASHKIGQFRILAMSDGLAIISLSSKKGFNVDIGTLLMARNEDIFTFTTKEGDLGFFTQSGFLPILGRIGSIIDSADRVINSNLSYAKKVAQVNQYNEQIKNLVGELKTGLSWYKNTGVTRDMNHPVSSFSHVPGTYTHIIGNSIWEIGPDDVSRTGELTPIWHSAGDEKWFHAYYEKDAQVCANASPDGKYAVTATHLYDLKEMRPLIELPFPSGPVGFTSSGSDIYAYDRVNNRVAFIAVEELLATCLGPWGSERNRGVVEK